MKELWEEPIPTLILIAFLFSVSNKNCHVREARFQCSLCLWACYCSADCQVCEMRQMYVWKAEIDGHAIMWAFYVSSSHLFIWNTSVSIIENVQTFFYGEISAFVCIYMCVCECVCVDVCGWVCASMCVHRVCVYVWVCVSVCICMYVLLRRTETLFSYVYWCVNRTFSCSYIALSDLAPTKPLYKFLTIKAVIFLSFWQSVFIAFLVYIGVIHVRLF